METTDFAKKIGAILAKTKKVAVEFPEGVIHFIDYRIISRQLLRHNKQPQKTDEETFLVTIPGSTSGWEQASELPFWLSYFGVGPNLVYSPLGEGHSSLAPEWFWKNNHFRNEAQICLSLLETLKVKKAVFIGHSNGAVTATEAALLAENYGVQPEGLILLAPADLKLLRKTSLPWLLIRFGISGWLLRKKFAKGDYPINQLKEYFSPPSPSPFSTKERLKKIFWEVRKSSQERLPKLLRLTDCPILCLFPEWDFVFPHWSRLWRKSRKEITEEAGAITRITCGLHNITLFRYAKQTAKEIKAWWEETATFSKSTSFF